MTTLNRVRAFSQKLRRDDGVEVGPVLADELDAILAEGAPSREELRKQMELELSNWCHAAFGGRAPSKMVFGELADRILSLLPASRPEPVETADRAHGASSPPASDAEINGVHSAALPAGVVERVARLLVSEYPDADEIDPEVLHNDMADLAARIITEVNAGLPFFALLAGNAALREKVRKVYDMTNGDYDDLCHAVATELRAALGTGKGG